MKILETKNLSYFYQDGGAKRIILKDVNISFESGKFYTIIGESGSGKTTLLSVLAGLDNPKSGQVLYKDEDIAKIGLDKYRRNYISMIFQNYNLINYLNAYDNVYTAMNISDNTKTKVNKEDIINILNKVGIDESKIKRRVTKLSGGEQQRVAIARALATNTEVIIADEPTGNLDIETSDYIVNLLKDLAHEDGKTIIMVTHNTDIAKVSDVIYKIDQLNKSVIEILK